MSLPNYSLARRLAAGETVYTGWCALPAPIVAETIAREGFNTVTIDQQHGLWGTDGTVTAIGAIRAAGAAPDRARPARRALRWRAARSTSAPRASSRR